MKIRIKYQDIVNYVLGSCSYHPLELEIDPMRYEIKANSILDTKAQIEHPQEEDYCNFIAKVEQLKLAAHDFNPLQVQEFCREIEDFSPLEINLL
jgi:hypothetical protein